MLIIDFHGKLLPLHSGEVIASQDLLECHCVLGCRSNATLARHCDPILMLLLQVVRDQLLSNVSRKLKLFCVSFIQKQVLVSKSESKMELV